MNIDADGFDQYGTTAYLLKYWNGSPTSIETGRPASAPATVVARKAVGLTNTSISRAWGTAEPTLTCGFAFYASSINDAVIMTFNNNSDVQVGLQLTAAGTIKVFRQFSFNVIGTCSGAGSTINAGVWNFIEVRCTFDSAFGVVEVRNNGATIGSFSSVNTDPAGSSSSNAIFLGGAASSPFAALRFDDFYLNDNNGPSDDTFLGDIVIHTLIPLSDGTTNQFSPEGEAANFQCVDNIPPDEGAVYVRGNSGKIDEYTTTSFAHLAIDIHFVRTFAFTAKTDAGLVDFEHRIRVSAATDNSASISATPDFTYSSALFKQNPNGPADWTNVTISSLNFGLEVV
jgi:hypothetical protein